MPYWIYSFEKNGAVSTLGSKYSHRSGDYVYYDDYTLTTELKAECNGISHDATSNFSDRLSEAIAPFSVKDKKKFSPAYLSGYYADNEDIDKVLYSNDSNSLASRHISNMLGKEKEYNKYSTKPKISLDEKSAELGLFPVYYLATKNKKGDRISYAVINGQTGKIAAEIPIDFGKFFVFSFLLAIPIFLNLNMFLTINMPQLVICSIFFNIISLCVLRKQSKKIELQEDELDDIGKKSKNTNSSTQKKEKTKNKSFTLHRLIFIMFITAMPFILFRFNTNRLYYSFFKLVRYISYLSTLIVPIIMIVYKIKNPKKDMGIFKPVIGLLLTIVLFCIKPAQDIYYYIVALVSICFAILSFYNIIKRYNILTTRKLPQLGKRGGDENA